MSEQQPFLVVGCDGTPASDAALRFAAAEAGLHGARLLLVTAYDRPIDPHSDDFDISDDALQRQARDDASASVNPHWIYGRGGCPNTRSSPLRASRRKCCSSTATARS